MNMEKVRDYLRLFRAQTAPATILLILVPYLANAPLLSVSTLAIGVFALVAHWFAFGHNSLMDTAMGYDKADPAKSHHPLVAGRISLTAAHNVIHWGLCGLAVLAIYLSFLSPVPVAALISIFLWFVFGYAYNSGLSKESLLGFLPIAACFGAMGAWGWFLSHDALNTSGLILLAYFFLTIVFQTSWSGHLKEMRVQERGNLLIRMGAQLKGHRLQERFIPGRSRIYGWFIKGLNLFLGVWLMLGQFNVVRLVWTVILGALIITSLHRLTRPRTYIRDKELRIMSVMEILTIYLPVPLVLPLMEATVLMLFGVVYFVVVNKVLWDASYPRV